VPRQRLSTWATVTERPNLLWTAQTLVRDTGIEVDIPRFSGGADDLHKTASDVL
jgi:hypothetical protein